MALFKKDSNVGLMDVIRCDEKNYLIWKWRPANTQLGQTNRENAIRWGSPIRVKEGSVAVFVHSSPNGFVQDYMVGPADTIVSTQNLPVLASLVGLAYNGGAPFQAEVYYINLAESVQVKYGIPYFDVFDSDPELKSFSVPVSVRGSVDFDIKDYQTFVKYHRLDEFSLPELQAQIKDSITESVKMAVLNAPETYNIPVVQIERTLGNIKKDIKPQLSQKLFQDYGVHLRDINITAIEVDKESDSYKELQSTTKKLTLKTRTAEQKIGVFEKAASKFIDLRESSYKKRKESQTEYADALENERAGHRAAATVKIIKAFADAKAQTSKNVSSSGSTPPPIPTVAYYVVVYGKQAGPYDMASLKQMVSNGTLNSESLVWTEGMKEWKAAKDVEALSGILCKDTTTTTPPSLPPVD